MRDLERAAKLRDKYSREPWWQSLGFGADDIIILYAATAVPEEAAAEFDKVFVAGTVEIDTTTQAGEQSRVLTEAEIQVFRKLRARGFAVIVWTPDELDGVDLEDLEDESVSFGWDFIGMRTSVESDE